MKRRGIGFCAAMFLCLGGIAISGFKIYRAAADDAENDAFYMALARTAADGAVQDGVDFAALQKENPDIVAWLRCLGTPLDYPVVQRDNAYYLKHRFDGAYSDFGTLFLDSGSSSDFTDKQSVIFGHNMHYGSAMLTSLMQYQRQAYYDAHPTLLLYTPERTYTVALFAACITREPEALLAAGAEAGADFWAEARAESCFTSDVTVLDGDRVLTLCTCAYYKREERMLLWGRLVPAEASQ